MIFSGYFLCGNLSWHAWNGCGSRTPNKARLSPSNSLAHRNVQLGSPISAHNVDVRLVRLAISLRKGSITTLLACPQHALSKAAFWRHEPTSPPRFSSRSFCVLRKKSVVLSCYLCTCSWFFPNLSPKQIMRNHGRSCKSWPRKCFCLKVPEAA